MPLGAAHAASVEYKMKLGGSKRSGENVYSTGFMVALSDDVNSRAQLKILPRSLGGVDGKFERDP